jgi:hypothetical protein
MQGILEEWNAGRLGLNPNRNFFTHHSIIPELNFDIWYRFYGEQNGSQR